MSICLFLRTEISDTDRQGRPNTLDFCFRAVTASGCLEAFATMNLARFLSRSVGDSKLGDAEGNSVRVGSS